MLSFIIDMSFKSVYLALFLAVLLGVSNANAKVFTENDVKNFVVNVGSESAKILNDTKSSKKQIDENYKAFSLKVINTEWIARFVLGNHWKQITSEQRKEFRELYKEYLIIKYVPKLREYSKSLDIIKVSKKSDKAFLVSTKAKDKSGKDINVDFRIVTRNNALYIADIIPEGMSFISVQRTDVGSAISQNGYNNFIKQLKEKVKEN